MKNCPNCGFDLRPPRRGYNGQLKPYLPTILEMLREGDLPSRIAEAIETQHGVRFRDRNTVAGVICVIRRAHGLAPPVPDTSERDRQIAEANASGVSMVKLARQFSMPAARIKRIISRHQDKVSRQELVRATVASATIDDIPIDALDIPVRIGHVLRFHDCKTVGDARKLSDQELLSLPNFNVTSLKCWKDCLDALHSVLP